MEELDIQDIIKRQFQAGEGVLLLQQDMPDHVLLLAIRTALSYGAEFKIVPAPKSRLN